MILRSVRAFEQAQESNLLEEDRARSDVIA